MKSRRQSPAHLWPLLALNFFMADMQSGIGPFVGVFLLERGWASGLIGTALTIGNVAGMAVTTPFGGFIDATSHKRAWIIIPGSAVVAGSAIILLSQDFWAVAISQIATSIAGAAIVPAVTGLTLGLVKQRGFNRQIGRNQAFNHAGNLVGAAASGYLGWRYGYVAVFLLAALFGVISIICVLLIPEEAIDHRAARGERLGAMRRGGGDHDVSIGAHLEQRQAREPLGDLARQPGLERGVGLLEVAGERGGQVVLAAEHPGQRIELEEMQLDEVGAEPAAPQHLGAQRLLDLLGAE